MSPALSSLRVLHIINGEHYSGAERVQDLLAIRLPQQGIEIGFACLKPIAFPARRTSRVPLFELPMQSRLDLWPAWRIADIVRRGGYRLLHTHTPRTALIGRIASHLTGVPWVHHVHSPTRFDTERLWKNRFNAICEGFSIRSADMLIAVSLPLKDYLLREGFPSERIQVVPNGIVLKSEPAPWSPPQNRPWEIGMVALFRPRKGLEVLLDALALLREQGLITRLRAVGPFESKAYEKEIRQRVEVKKLGDSVHWVGFTSDIDEELARMDIFVLPSLYGEGLPMALLEAMRAGVPIVASNVEGVTQAVDHGVHGLLVEAGNTEPLVAALRAIIRGECSPQTLRQNAYTRQSNEFSDVQMAHSVAAIYRKVLR